MSARPVEPLDVGERGARDKKELRVTLRFLAWTAGQMARLYLRKAKPPHTPI